MTTCATCGSHLTKDYLRVCGDNDDTVRDCPHCEATRRAEARRSTADDGDSDGTEEESDSSKLVLTAETNTDGPDAAGGNQRGERRGPGRADGAHGRSGSTTQASVGRKDRGRPARAGRVAGETREGESESRPSVLSSVFDALR